MISAVQQFSSSAVQQFSSSAVQQLWYDTKVTHVKFLYECLIRIVELLFYSFLYDRHCLHSEVEQNEKS